MHTDICVQATGQYWVFFSIDLLRQGLTVELNSLTQLYWMASKTKRSRLHLASPGIPQALYLAVRWGWRSELALLCLCSKHLTHWAIYPQAPETLTYSFPFPLRQMGSVPTKLWWKNKSSQSSIQQPTITTWLRLGHELASTVTNEKAQSVGLWWDYKQNGWHTSLYVLY